MTNDNQQDQEEATCMKQLAITYESRQNKGKTGNYFFSNCTICAQKPGGEGKPCEDGWWSALGLANYWKGASSQGI